MLTLGQDKHQSAKFSVTIQLRDKKGNITGKTKSYHTDSAQDLAAFYERHQPRRSRKKKVHPNKLPKKDEAEKLLVEVAEYAEKKQEERK